MTLDEALAVMGAAEYDTYGPIICVTEEDDEMFCLSFCRGAMPPYIQRLGTLEEIKTILRNDLYGKVALCNDNWIAVEGGKQV